VLTLFRPQLRIKFEFGRGFGWTSALAGTGQVRKLPIQKLAQKFSLL
jgi:hypothetical protein